MLGGDCGDEDAGRSEGAPASSDDIMLIAVCTTPSTMATTLAAISSVLMCWPMVFFGFSAANGSSGAACGGISGA